MNHFSQGKALDVVIAIADLAMQVRILTFLETSKAETVDRLEYCMTKEDQKLASIMPSPIHSQLISSGSGRNSDRCGMDEEDNDVSHSRRGDSHDSVCFSLASPLEDRLLLGSLPPILPLLITTTMERELQKPRMRVTVRLAIFFVYIHSSSPYHDRISGRPREEQRQGGLLSNGRMR